MPQCDDIVIARGRQAEGCRLHAASAVEIGMEWFDKMLPHPIAIRCLRLFAPRTLRGYNSLWSHRTDAIESVGIGQCGLVVKLSLWRHERRFGALRVVQFRYSFLSLPVHHHCQENSKYCCQEPYRIVLPLHYACKVRQLFRINRRETIKKLLIPAVVARCHKGSHHKSLYERDSDQHERHAIGYHENDKRK